MWQVTMVDVLILDTSLAMVRCTHCLEVFKTIPKQISSSAKWTLTQTQHHLHKTNKTLSVKDSYYLQCKPLHSYSTGYI